MKIFQDLGEKIEKIWRDKNYDEDSFPQIAENALLEADLPKKVSPWEIATWALGETFLPRQHDLPANFGDPPITLYNAPRFYIDAYFWLNGTTQIHQHAFCGAFQVLHGSSIHSQYNFNIQEKLNFFTEIGDINLQTVELLKVGDTHQIIAGKAFIHALFHLDQPSVSIIVRTGKTPLEMPQYIFHKPFLAIDPFFEEPNMLRKMQFASMLLQANHTESDKLITELLEKSDFQTTYLILSNIRKFYKDNQLDKKFGTANAENRLIDLMKVVAKRHGEIGKSLTKIFQNQDESQQIISRRNYITDAEQRFFLALLLNVEGKDRIFSLIKEKFVDENPLDKVLDWSFDLAQTKVLGQENSNALGIENFDDFDLLVLEKLLDSTDTDEAKKNITTEFGNSVNEQSIENKITIFKNSVIFKPFWK